MNKHIKLYLFSFAILLLLSISHNATACTCATTTPCQSYAKASSVFVGSVMKVGIEPSKGRPPSNAMSTTLTSSAPVVRFRVEESFLGVDTKEIEIHGDGTTCDFYFKEGEQYLVYAYRNREDQRLHTSICTRTALLSEAEEDLLYLRNEAKASSGSTVLGNVSRVVYEVAKDEPTVEPLSKTKVIFESGNRRFEAVADNKGDFNLRGLPQGRYKIRTNPVTNSSSAATDFDEPQTEWELDVTDRGCVKIWFGERPNGEITGQVYENAGLFVKDIEVELIPADRKATTSNLRTVMVDEEGRFRFTFLPPGRYLLGFNLLGGPSLHDPYSESYYPGVDERDKATIITVNKEQKVTGLELPLPLRKGERMIKGIAVWPDGRPAVGVPIELNNPRTGYREGNSVQTDAQGRFAIKAIDGQTYELSALINVGIPLVNSKPVMIQVGKENQKVKLIIESPQK